MEWKFWRGWQVDFWKLKRVRGGVMRYGGEYVSDVI